MNKDVEPLSTLLRRNKVVVQKNKEIASFYPTDIFNDLGIWIMVFNRRWFDLSWERACKLYTEKALPGIAYLKAAYQKDDDQKGVIMFYCGPLKDNNLMEYYGQNLADEMKYTSPDGEMNFKVYDQVTTFRICCTIKVATPWERKRKEFFSTLRS